MPGSYFLGPPARRRHRPRRAPLLLVVGLLIAGVVAAAVVLAAGLDSGSPNRHGGAMQSFTVDSKFVKERLEQQVAVPDGGAAGRPLLVLLHGRNSKPADMFPSSFWAELARLGNAAPVVVAVNGGASSYYHDRKSGAWGRYLFREAIPQAVAKYRVDAKRIAIGGTSMGGFGALDLARLHPKSFCAVGGHSAAIWKTGGETPKGAFDNARDFKKHDIYAAATDKKTPYAGQKLWIDVGRDDPFRQADTAFSRALKKGGADVTFHVFPGGHGQAYYAAHAAEYLQFYSSALARC
jgi:enterochelin esterase-like enzyme